MHRLKTEEELLETDGVTKIIEGTEVSYCRGWDTLTLKMIKELEDVLDIKEGPYGGNFIHSWMLIPYTPHIVQTVEQDYLERFEEITKEMLEVSKAKNSDYTADSGDPFANFKLVEKMNICSVETGFLTRMTDKMARLAGLASNKELKVADEKYIDTLTDLANYSILLRLYLERKVK